MKVIWVLICIGGPLMMIWVMIALGKMAAKDNRWMEEYNRRMK